MHCYRRLLRTYAARAGAGVRATAAGLRQLERQPESVMGWVPKLAQESICFVSSVVRRLSRGWQRLHSGRTRRHAGIGPVGFTCDAEEGGGV